MKTVRLDKEFEKRRNLKKHLRSLGDWVQKYFRFDPDDELVPSNFNEFLEGARVSENEWVIRKPILNVGRRKTVGTLIEIRIRYLDY